MNKIAAMEVLRTRGWLAGTPEAFRAVVLSSCDLLHLRRGQPVYSAGDPSGGMFGVAAGRVELHLPSADGAPTLSHLGEAGFWAGDVAAVAGHARLLTITAAADSRVMRLSRASMVRIGREDPDAWLHFARLMAHNFATSIHMIGVLRRDHPTSRVAALLLNLAADLPEAKPAIRASQTELGSMANIGRTAVNVALGEFEARGLIRRGYAEVQIIDRAGLEYASGGEPADLPEAHRAAI